jgi:hypothetical protein
MFEEMRIAAGNRLSLLNELAVPPGLDSMAQNTRVGLSEQEQAEVELLKSFLNDMGSWLSVHPDGPLWFRGYGKWTESEGIEFVSELLRRYGAEHFVVGHTITADRDILERFGGRVFLVDTVQPSALEIKGGQFMGIYREGREAPTVAQVEPAQTAVGN